MNFNEYRQAAAGTWKFGGDSYKDALSYLTHGLTGEAGEVAEYVKKLLWHGKKPDIEGLPYELGDVLWYLDRLAALEGYTLEQIAEMNVAKLKARHG